MKEGRKYDLGALMITQQPGSIPEELLSQGDNFFVFHLLSQGDLVSLKRANAHFSDDLLAALLNEPLVGHGVFWSSAPGTDQHARPYPLSVRVLNFSKAHTRRDPKYDGQQLDDISAAKMRASFTLAAEKAAQAIGSETPTEANAWDEGDDHTTGAPAIDVEKSFRNAAIQGLRAEASFWERARSQEGIKWGQVQSLLAKHGPDVVPDKFEWARHLVKEALDETLGVKGVGWTVEKREDGRQWITARPPNTMQDENAPPDLFDQRPPHDDEPPF